MKKINKNAKLSESINYAIEGIAIAIRTERNMRIHVFMAILVVILCLIYSVTSIEVRELSFAISLVFLAELMNTAIEASIDINTSRYHILAKKAKDAAAGGVLVASINALIVGYIIFSRKIKNDSIDILKVLKHSYTDTFLAILFLVVISVFIIKSYYQNKNLFRGGMPSGHTAIAFSLWVGISYVTKNIIITILSFFMALLVAQSRIEGKIHSPREVVVGSIIGTFMTYILLKVIF